MNRPITWIALSLAACQDVSIVDPGRGVGSGEPPLLSTPTRLERVRQVDRPEVDVLWVLDNSCSMAEEQAALAHNFPVFMNIFLESNLDWHIGLVSTDTDNPEENGKLLGAGGFRFIDPTTPNPLGVFRAMTELGTAGSPHERGLLAAYRAIVQPTEDHRRRNRDFIREDASLHIIVISDEEDQSAPWVRRNEFVTFLDTLKGDPDIPVTFSAITGPVPAGCRGSGGSADPGSIYINTAQATGGLWTSICEEDWSPLLIDLGLLAAGRRREFFLSQLPVPGSIEVWTVEGDFQYDGVDRAKIGPQRPLKQLCEEQGGYVCFPFDYDPRNNSIRLDPESVPAPGAEIFVRYELLSQQQPPGP